VLAEIGKGKTKLSRSAMPMHPILAEARQEWRRETLYHRETNWVFASYKCGGKIPRCGSVAAADYLRPAAVKAGLGVYAHANSDNKLAAQGEYLGALAAARNKKALEAVDAVSKAVQ
jgi:hypothetical protein